MMEKPTPAFLPPVPEPAAVFGQPTGPAGEPATWGRRVGAFLLDVMVLVAICAAFGVLYQALIGGTSVDDEGYETPHGLLAASYAAPFISSLYFWILNGLTGGRTLGKRAVGIRIVADTTGEPVGWATALGREASRFALGIFALPLLASYLWPLWHPQRRTLHDLMAGTRVVRDLEPARDPFGRQHSA